MGSKRNIVLVSYTSLDSPGGVPRWNRDFIKCFPEAAHYSWQDFSRANGDFPVPEWQKAEILERWLLQTGRRKPDDIVIGDGWWAGSLHPENIVSVCHGIWGHLLKEEADAGMEPDFPDNHREQIFYRKRISNKGRLVSVSEFIKHQMAIQWGFKSTVINNAIDNSRVLEHGSFIRSDRSRPLVIHGINDESNLNKGFDHIEFLKSNVDLTLWSLDEAHHLLQQLKPLYLRNEYSKFDTLRDADFVVIPSAYEGNSYFALETLACGIPVVAYDVGLFWEMSPNNEANGIIGDYSPGIILDRKRRSKETTLEGVKLLIEMIGNDNMKKRCLVDPKRIAERYDIKVFRNQWKDYLKREFGYE